MDTAALERAERWVSKIIDRLDTASTVISDVALKVSKALDNFADALEDEIYKAREAHDDAVAQSMSNHPAGKGRVERKEKIDAIVSWLKETPHTKAAVEETLWVTNPDEITDEIVNYVYALLQRTKEDNQG